LQEFSKYGSIRRFCLVRDIVTRSSKGYAFIEYEKKEAANQAYHYANNLIIDGRRIFVDFECERKLPGWKPRRLGIYLSSLVYSSLMVVQSYDSWTYKY
jgi:U11/U12 small nuclear ribonucleoprotein SNRNP35